MNKATCSICGNKKSIHHFALIDGSFVCKSEHTLSHEKMISIKKADGKIIFVHVCLLKVYNDFSRIKHEAESIMNDIEKFL